MSWINLLPWEIIKRESGEYGISPLLVAAIIGQESGGDTYAIRFEKAFPYRDKISAHAIRNNISPITENMLQGCSIGLMQVMGLVARENAYEGNLLRLTIPEVGIAIGCKQLKRLHKRYSKQVDIIAAYNAGSVVMKDGRLLNQKYVDEVLLKIGEIS